MTGKRVMQLTKKQKDKVADLLVRHRAVEEVADYEDSPTMQAAFKYVNFLLEYAYRKGAKSGSKGNKK